MSSNNHHHHGQKRSFSQHRGGSHSSHRGGRGGGGSGYDRHSHQHDRYKDDRPSKLPAQPLQLQFTTVAADWPPITERQVGIVHYLGDHLNQHINDKHDGHDLHNQARNQRPNLSISGTLKTRYTDFIVREVTLDSQIVRLNDTQSLPMEDQTRAATAGHKPNGDANGVEHDAADYVDQGLEALKAICGDEAALAFTAWLGSPASQTFEDFRSSFRTPLRTSESPIKLPDTRDNLTESQIKALVDELLHITESTNDYRSNYIVFPATLDNNQRALYHRTVAALYTPKRVMHTTDLLIGADGQTQQHDEHQPATSIHDPQESITPAHPKASKPCCVVVRALPPYKPAEYVFDVDLDKLQRKALHQCVREHHSHIVTDAVDAPSAANSTTVTASRVRARFKSAVPGSQQDRRAEQRWPKETHPQYLQFTLLKQNLGTQDAVLAISNATRCSVQSFGFAGTKDKRAVTAQEVTLYETRAERLHKMRLFGLHPSQQIAVGNFRYVHNPLRLGDLRGNRFELILRDVQLKAVAARDNADVPDDSIVNVPSSVKELLSHGADGFINYYGMQRFGNSGIPSHLIGSALIASNYRRAVELILTPREAERDDVREARQHLVASKDITSTLRRLPPFMKLERSVLEHLMRHSTDYQNAIQSLPRTMRLMYVHSWQSYVWNKVASARVALGLRPTFGDLIMTSKVSDIAKRDSAPSTMPSQPQTNGEVIENDATRHIDADSICEGIREDVASNMSVRALTADDLVSNNYTIYDVVLPLPGSAVQYPSHLRTVYDQLMAEHNVTTEQFTNHASKDFNLAGGYRKLLERPCDYEYDVLEYERHDEELTTTELSDRRPQVSAAVTKPTATIDAAPHKHLAVRLLFTLPSSTYATMFLREFTREETTEAAQKVMMAEQHQQRVASG